MYYLVALRFIVIIIILLDSLYPHTHYVSQEVNMILSLLRDWVLTAVNILMWCGTVQQLVPD
jgi:hypothetical protein